MPGGRHARVGGRDVDDAPGTSLLDHPARRRPREEEGSPEVHGQDAIPEERVELPHAADRPGPGRVEDDVEPPEAGHGLGHRPLAGVGLAHVALERDDRLPPERLGRLRETLRALVEDGDACSRGHPRRGRGPADPGGAPAHERDLSRELPDDVRHGYAPTGSSFPSPPFHDPEARVNRRGRFCSADGAACCRSTPLHAWEGS